MASVTTRGIKGLLAHVESALKSERQRVVLAKKAQDGLPVGPMPFGYRQATPRSAPVLHDREAEALRGMFQRKLHGDTNGQIAEWINEQGIRTKDEHQFTSHAVKDLLNCRFLTGVVTHHDQVHPGQHEAIIPPEVFDRLHARRHLRRRRPRRQYAGPPGLWHGRLYCIRCGRPIQSERDGRQQPRYRERHAWACSTNNRSRAAHYFDDQGQKILTAVELPPDTPARMAELAVADYDGPDISNLEDHRRRLIRAYAIASDSMSDAEFETRLADLDAQIQAATPTVRPDLEEALTLFSDLDQLWEEATEGERQRLIAPFIERAYADIETRRIGAIAPTPAFRTLLERALVRAGQSDVVLLAPDECEKLGVVETGEAPLLATPPDCGFRTRVALSGALTPSPGSRRRDGRHPPISCPPRARSEGRASTGPRPSSGSSSGSSWGTRSTTDATSRSGTGGARVRAPRSAAVEPRTTSGSTTARSGALSIRR